MRRAGLWLGAVVAAGACSGLVAWVGCGNKSSPAVKKDAASDGTVRDVAMTADAATPALCPQPISGTTISVQQVAQVPGSAVIVAAPVGDARVFVAEQDGRIDLLDASYNLLAAPFLDLSANNNGPVVSGGELGLLGLVFDPGYATNRELYVDYTMNNPGSDAAANPYLDVVERFTTMAGNANVADPNSGTVILAIPDFASNHNAGMLQFGSDGDLYIATGDGGDEGDPERNGQNPNALLSKMLRIDVEHPAAGSAYSIPADNPFATNGSGAPEIFMLGLRNPWRWSFDTATGDMWIADVGQDEVEELDYLPAGQQLGQNLGWSVYEGNTCCELQTGLCHQTGAQQPCNPAGLVFPQVTELHSNGYTAIIGGAMYRGSCYPDIVGTFFYTDYGLHGMSEATVGSGGTVTAVDLAGTWPQVPSSISADGRGELYETTTTGAIYHIEAGSGSGSG